MGQNHTIDQAAAAVAPILEGVANATTVRPGALIRYNEDGGVCECGDPLVDGHHTSPMFAVSDFVGGMSYDDFYPLWSTVYFRHFRPGDVVLAWAATFQNIVIGDFLTASRDTAGKRGNLSIAINPSRGIAVALEPLATSGEALRIKVVIK